MKVKTSFRLTKAAQQSLRSIAYYTEQRWGKAQRNHYLQILDDHFHKLAKQPMKGRLRHELRHNLRSYQVNSHHIFYLLRENEIIIVDILHEKMDYLQHINEM